MMIRQFREADRDAIKAITAICFEGVAIDHAIEERFGLVGGKDWRYRKVRHIDADIAANAAGIFVAEANEQVIGYITTRIDQATKIGSIPNLGVLPAYRGGGIGRKLIDTAVAYATAQGMQHLRIETLAHNPIGQYLYPSCSFQEVARQIHYVMPLGDGDKKTGRQEDKYVEFYLSCPVGTPDFRRAISKSLFQLEWLARTRSLKSDVPTGQGFSS